MSSNASIKHIKEAPLDGTTVILYAGSASKEMISYCRLGKFETINGVKGWTTWALPDRVQFGVRFEPEDWPKAFITIENYNLTQDQIEIYNKQNEHLLFGHKKDSKFDLIGPLPAKRIILD